MVRMTDVNGKPSGQLNGSHDRRHHLGNDQPSKIAGKIGFGQEQAGLDRAKAKADEETHLPHLLPAGHVDRLPGHVA